jgi:hypothetical protein
VAAEGSCARLAWFLSILTTTSELRHVARYVRPKLPPSSICAEKQKQKQKQKHAQTKRSVDTAPNTGAGPHQEPEGNIQHARTEQLAILEQVTSGESNANLDDLELGERDRAELRKTGNEESASGLGNSNDNTASHTCTPAQTTSPEPEPPLPLAAKQPPSLRLMSSRHDVILPAFCFAAASAAASVLRVSISRRTPSNEMRSVCSVRDPILLAAGSSLLAYALCGTCWPCQSPSPNPHQTGPAPHKNTLIKGYKEGSTSKHARTTSRGPSIDSRTKCCLYWEKASPAQEHTHIHTIASSTTAASSAITNLATPGTKERPPQTNL